MVSVCVYIYIYIYIYNCSNVSQYFVYITVYTVFLSNKCSFGEHKRLLSNINKILPTPNRHKPICPKYSCNDYLKDCIISLIFVLVLLKV